MGCASYGIMGGTKQRVNRCPVPSINLSWRSILPEQQFLIFQRHSIGRTKGCDLADSNPLISKSAGIYVITHCASGKSYVGSATDLCRRHGEHQRMLRRGAHENDHLQKAWNRHGKEAFSFMILFYCAPSDLLFYEQRVLDYHKRTLGWRQMYNSNPTAGSRLGSPKSAEERAKISVRMKGNAFTKGRPLSPSHKAKISAFMRTRDLGKQMSAETKAKIAAANRGREVSAETRAKISAAGKGRKLSEAHKARLANSPRFKGRHHTEETKAWLAITSRQAALNRQRDKTTGRLM